MILIWTPYKTKRVIYTFDYIFSNLLNLKHIVTSNRSDYETYQGAKFIYSPYQIKNENWICAHNLLFDNGIKKYEIEVKNHTDYKKIFFANDNPNSLLPFDIFAATFYLLSRYEEYSSSSLDNHGRFTYTESLAHKNNFLHLPIINLWAKEFYKILSSLFSLPEQKKSAIKIIPTFDVDNFFAFRGKTFLKSFLATFNALKNKRFDLLKLRFFYLINRINDPYDTFDYIKLVLNKYALTPYYFILTGKTSSFDTNLHPEHILFKNQTKKLSEYSNIGIHLSYYSVEKNNIANEKQLLEDIINLKIENNRFHFLRFNLPKSYQELIRHGITSDYSMGYPNIDGFRASTCVPFYFYDINEEKTTSLLIYPFPFMDRHIISFSESENEILEKIDYYINTIKAYNGTLVLLWHNETLQNNKYWQLSKKVFEYTLKKAMHEV